MAKECRGGSRRFTRRRRRGFGYVNGREAGRRGGSGHVIRSTVVGPKDGSIIVPVTK